MSQELEQWVFNWRYVIWHIGSARLRFMARWVGGGKGVFTTCWCLRDVSDDGGASSGANVIKTCSSSSLKLWTKKLERSSLPSLVWYFEVNPLAYYNVLHSVSSILNCMYQTEVFSSKASNTFSSASLISNRDKHSSLFARSVCDGRKKGLYYWHLRTMS